MTAVRPEKTLLYLGLGYGLSEDAIRSYLCRKEYSLLEKHLCMLCRILGMDVFDRDMDNDKDVAGQSGKHMLFYTLGRLDAIMRKYYKFSFSK